MKSQYLFLLEGEYCDDQEKDLLDLLKQIQQVCGASYLVNYDFANWEKGDAINLEDFKSIEATPMRSNPFALNINIGIGDDVYLHLYRISFYTNMCKVGVCYVGTWPQKNDDTAPWDLISAHILKLETLQLPYGKDVRSA